jgi:hypothetical protein
MGQKPSRADVDPGAVASPAPGCGSPETWHDFGRRTQSERIIRRAGLEPWPRLLHNLRASKGTELARRFPVHVVASWLGNTPRIARRHYLQVTEADFAKTVQLGDNSASAVRNPMH